jgi:hypothetical protein
MHKKRSDGYGMCAEPTCRQAGAIELICTAGEWLGIFCLPHGPVLALDGRRLRGIPASAAS